MKNKKRNYKCSIGECPFCLALYETNHSSDCPIFTGFDDDSELKDIIEIWQKKNEEINIVEPSSKTYSDKRNMKTVESIKKSVLKTISWRIIAIIISILVAYLFTHSYSQSFGLAITANIISMIAYYLHERIWSRYI